MNERTSERSKERLNEGRKEGRKEGGRDGGGNVVTLLAYLAMGITFSHWLLSFA